MSCLSYRDAGAAAPGTVAFRRALLRSVVDWVKLCRRRRQERRELLDFVHCDHRAAADLGMTIYEARSLGTRPFWRS